MKILRINCIFLDFFVAKRPWICKQTPADNPQGGRRLCPRRGWLSRDKTEGGMKERYAEWLGWNDGNAATGLRGTTLRLGLPPRPYLSTVSRAGTANW